ncbi:MAG: hypothetical protein RL198_92 [Actinomycetota bacterium]
MAGSRTHWFADENLSSESGSLAAANLVRAKSLRLKPGERIAVTNGRGLVAHCQVTAVSAQTVDFFQLSLLESPQPPQRTVIQALIKHDSVEDALRLATEFGATRLIPWQAERSVLRWDALRAEKQRARLTAIAKEQALLNQSPWFPVVETVCDKLPSPSGIGLLLDGAADTQLAALLSDQTTSEPLSTDSLSVVVGPEGGLTDSEIESAVSLGYRPVSLGNTSFRSFSAGAAALSLINARTWAS